MQKYRELFKSHFTVDYINIDCNIPQFIRNKIYNFSVEYQDECSTYITRDKCRELYTDDDDVYLNRMKHTDIEFNMNDMICNYQIITYNIRLSKSIKKCINQIDFIIMYPINEIYETNKSIYVNILKYLNDVIKSTIKCGINRKISDEVSFKISNSERKQFNSIINTITYSSPQQSIIDYEPSPPAVIKGSVPISSDTFTYKHKLNYCDSITPNFQRPAPYYFKNVIPNISLTLSAFLPKIILPDLFNNILHVKQNTIYRSSTSINLLAAT